MASIESGVRMSDVMSGVVVKVRLTGVRVFRFRLWLGLAIVKLGVRVIGAEPDVGVFDAD